MRDMYHTKKLQQWQMVVVTILSSIAVRIVTTWKLRQRQEVLVRITMHPLHPPQPPYPLQPRRLGSGVFDDRHDRIYTFRCLKLC